MCVCLECLCVQLPYRDEALDERLKLMQEVVTSLRGMKADYLPNSARPEGEEGVVSWVYMCMCVCVCLCVHIHTYTHTHLNSTFLNASFSLSL